MVRLIEVVCEEVNRLFCVHLYIAEKLKRIF